MNFTTFILQIHNYPANLDRFGGNKKDKYSKLKELKRPLVTVIAALAKYLLI